jgi:putative restriction endonuclease
MAIDRWTHEQLSLTFNLYCKIPFGKYHQYNPEVKSLANLIGRTPSAVAMKLANFASLDPQHYSRGVKGLTNISKADREAWDEFTSDWNTFAIESEVLLSQLVAEDQISLMPTDTSEEILESISTRQTEIERSVKVRMGQGFFRKTVLTNYYLRCCICGIPISSLLIASHIIPWKDRTDLRLNPYNGLCLCALHDKAFDLGFITVSSTYDILISSKIDSYLPNEGLENGFEIYKGKKISLPDKIHPTIE